MNELSVSVLILATDESKALKQTVDYINNKCTEKIDKTIIILSRNASGECLSMVELLKNTYCDTVDFIIQTEDGLGAAAIQGIQKVETTHMTYFAADLAIELESLDRMVAAAKNNPEKIIKSSRWLEKGSFIGYNKPRLVFNRLAQCLLKFLFFTNLTDLTNPVQIVPTEYEKSINWIEKGFCSSIEHTIVPVRLGYECIEVPTKCYPRTEGKSKNSIIKTSLYLRTALRVRFTSKNKFFK